jgi:hypothetical protein
VSANSGSVVVFDEGAITVDRAGSDDTDSAAATGDGLPVVG